MFRLIFFHNKFLSCAFSKHIFKSNYLFHSFMYQEQILVLYFLCINDKHFSSVFSIFKGKYLSHIFYASPTNILSHDFVFHIYL